MSRIRHLSANTANTNADVILVETRSLSSCIAGCGGHSDWKLFKSSGVLVGESLDKMKMDYEAQREKILLRTFVQSTQVHGAKDRIGPIGHREVAGTLNPPIRLHISSETRGANVATEISAELFKSEQRQLINCLYNAARMAG